MSFHVTNSNWEETLKNNAAVIVDFSATWCGPCKKLAPIVDEAATTYEGRVMVCKADVEEADEVAARYSIRNVPTILYFKNGEQVDKTVGPIDKKTLSEKIEALL